jgi:predicted nuclease of restriction endonuclease-like RecB superfamily
LLSADLLSYSVAGTLAVPHYLGEHDHPWLRALLDEHERFIGRPRRELEARLRDLLPCDSPPQKLRLAIQGMLFRATVVRIEIEGNTRVLVRHAKWRGLICTLAGRSDSGLCVQSECFPARTRGDRDPVGPA